MQHGYDFAVLGNHEFDYGMEQLGKLIGSAGAQYLGCNIRYLGEGEYPPGQGCDSGAKRRKKNTP